MNKRDTGFKRSVEDNQQPIADNAGSGQLGRMKSKLTLSILACVLLTTPTSFAVALGPQLPIAAGPVESVIEVIRQARICGFGRLRVELSNDAASAEEAKLFLDDVPGEDADQCLDTWITTNGIRLRLSPRWHGDTFEQTHHDLYAEARRRNSAGPSHE